MAFLRQQTIIDPAKLENLTVNIIGAGAIGSFSALALTKMGVKKLTIFDNDEVALHNVSNQFFTLDNIGKSKVKATEQECLRHSPQKIEFLGREEFYIDQPLDGEIVIAVTDNIGGRANAFKAARESPVTNFFIDARMNADLIRVFTLNPKSIKLAKKYEKDFLEGVENSEEPCTARSVIYNVLMASSLIATNVKKYVLGEPTPFQFIFNFTDFSQVISKGGKK